MYKKILFICCIFLLSGCTRISNDNQYIDLVNHCFVEKKITNDVALGYKYYIPRGVEKIHDYDYNQEFLVDNTSIYLYVDRRSRLINILARGDNIDEAYRRNLSDVGQFDEVIKEVDYVIDNTAFHMDENQVLKCLKEILKTESPLNQSMNK